jgi:hypothetical protein
MSEAPATRPRTWFAPVPARRLELVRRCTFGYALAWLVVRFAYVADVASLPARRFEPVGVLNWMDEPPSRPLVIVVWLVTLVACGSTTLDQAARFAAPVGAVGMLFLATLTSSYGQVFHTEHLLVLHLAVLAVGALVEPPAQSDGETSGWPLNLMMAIVVVTYVLAGVAKLRWSGAEWVTGDVLQNWIAIDNLRKLLFEDLYSPIGGWLSTIGWFWFPVAVLTLVVELGAPLVLVPGRARTGWLIAAWGFHLGVFALMAISFPYQLLGIAYLAFVRPDVWEQRLRSRSGLMLRSRLAARTTHTGRANT